MSFFAGIFVGYCANKLFAWINRNFSNRTQKDSFVCCPRGTPVSFGEWLKQNNGQCEPNLSNF